MEDRIAKERLNIILLIDASKSMSGNRIGQVDSAIKDIQEYLKELEVENTNVDFYLTLIPFSNSAEFYHGDTMKKIDDFQYDGIRCGGWSNLHFGYEKLAEILKKERNGGVMPDFGGAAPIILLLTDGHPTGNQYKEKLDLLLGLPWFKAALRYGIAIELDDKKTVQVLHDFVGNNGDVVMCYNSSLLKNIIKVIVLTASKVKSSNSTCSFNPKLSRNVQVQQAIAEGLENVEGLEW